MKKHLDSEHHRGIDLHIHSNASDGTYPPHKLIEMADRLGLGAIAITDHDTVEGSRQVLTSSIPDHIQFLTGVEISTQAPAGIKIDGSLHILGYGIDLDNTALENALTKLKDARSKRIPQIVAQLQSRGIDITLEQVLAEVGTGTPGRPHVASALIKNGSAATVDEAFDKHLAKGRPGYVDKYRIDCTRGLELIQGAGGVAVLAHPYLLEDDHLMNLLDILVPLGLKGIEAYYSHHGPDDVARYLELALKYNLLVTGGSDFHGDIIPSIQMGTGTGDLFVPYSVFDNFVNHHSNQKKS